MGAAASLGGEKRDDPPKDRVQENANAAHPRFYGFLGSGGGGVAASPRAAGCEIYNRRLRYGSLIFLALGSVVSIFLEGVALTDLSRVTNDDPSCSVSEEEGGLGFFCSSEEEVELGFSVGMR